jgi:multidrug efflux pump subunit AcrB
MGLVIVVLILLLFLNGRVTAWVALGIPTAFMATLAVVWLVGGSINMISLFALIMALGVIVDDAIVVGEDAYAHHKMGENPMNASEGGARRMFWPVIASSLTTVAAFLPLMLVSGPMGKIMGDIPFIMICVLIASVIECFFILPAHLRNAFTHDPGNKPYRLRTWLDNAFEHFRDGPFRRAGDPGDRLSRRHRHGGPGDPDSGGRPAGRRAGQVHLLPDAGAADRLCQRDVRASGTPRAR